MMRRVMFTGLLSACIVSCQIYCTPGTIQHAGVRDIRLYDTTNREMIVTLHKGRDHLAAIRYALGLRGAWRLETADNRVPAHLRGPVLTNERLWAVAHTTRRPTVEIAQIFKDFDGARNSRRPKCVIL